MRIQRLAAALATLLATAAPAGASEDPYLGEIALVPYLFCPGGWIEATGQELRIEEHEALFRLIGITYGGDGKETFALPNLRNAVPLKGMRYCIALEGERPDRS